MWGPVFPGFSGLSGLSGFPGLFYIIVYSAHLRCFDVMVRWWFNVSKERFNIYCACVRLQSFGLIFVKVEGGDEQSDMYW